MMVRAHAGSAAAFAELAALPDDETREPAPERSLNLVELEEPDDTPGEPDPAGGVGAPASDGPDAEPAPEPAFEWIIPPAPPPVDRAHTLGAER